MNMKNIVKAAVGALVLTSAFACTPKAEYMQFDFASLYVASAKVNEDCGNIEIPVRLYVASDKETVISYKFVDNTAKAGDNYKGQGNGTLSFAPGDTLKTIALSIVNKNGEFTGDLDFNIELTGATNDVQIGAINLCKITIADLDHPLTSLFGDYDMQAVTLASGGYIIAKWSMAISQYEGNPYRCWISNIIPFNAANYYGSYLSGSTAVYGEVTKDLKTITIPLPQQLEVDCYDAFGDPDTFLIYKWDGNNANGANIMEPSQITFELQEDGSYKTIDSYNMCTEAEAEGGLYYDYMQGFGGFNPGSYPCMFKKQ